MDQSFFSNNRTRLLEKLQGGVVVLAAFDLMQYGNDSAGSFLQESNFWYLTGIEEPSWWLILDGSRHKSWLVAPSLNERQRVFDGGLSPETAKSVSGVDTIISRDEAGTLLRELSKKHSLAYGLGEDPYAEYYDFTLNPAPAEMWRRLARTFDSVQDCRTELASLRAIKQPDEIKRMKKAIALTVDAFEHAKQRLPSVKHEYELQAEFDYMFTRHGATHAYEPIVAGGAHACTLHYNTNSARLAKRNLVLLDIGARLDGYTADITRTYAVGQPTNRQQTVHAAVHYVQQEIIKLLSPGLSIQRYHESVEQIMRSALVEIGLMKDESDNAAYHEYFPHAISHGLGIDVHDSLGRPEVLLPGMVLTVEPGIYVSEEGIGVRIEDDILITESGAINLSTKLSTSL